MRMRAVLFVQRLDLVVDSAADQRTGIFKMNLRLGSLVIGVGRDVQQYRTFTASGHDDFINAQVTHFGAEFSAARGPHDGRQPSARTFQR